MDVLETSLRKVQSLTEWNIFIAFQTHEFLIFYTIEIPEKEQRKERKKEYFQVCIEAIIIL